MVFTKYGNDSMNNSISNSVYLKLDYYINIIIGGVVMEKNIQEPAFLEVNETEEMCAMDADANFGPYA
jgi:hypothetical protein